MADKPLTGLPAGSGFIILDFVYAVIAGNSRKIPGTDFNAAIDSIVVDATAARLGILTDNRAIVKMTSAVACTYTIQPDSAVAHPVKAQIGLLQYGTGQLSIIAGSGVTIHYEFETTLPIPKSVRQYSLMVLIKMAANEWLLTGSFADV